MIKPRPARFEFSRTLFLLKLPGRYPNLWCDGKTAFRVNVPVNGSIFAKITFLHSSGDLDLSLRNAAGVLIAQSNSTSDSELIETTGLSAGDYDLIVTGYNGATNRFALTLLVNGVGTGSLNTV
jgi:hypothetical protein